jgi:hypothetical protein
MRTNVAGSSAVGVIFPMKLFMVELLFVGAKKDQQRIMFGGGNE